MTTKERKEHIRLGRLWLNRKATKRQIARCMELDRKAEFENRQLIFSGEAKAEIEIISVNTPSPAVLEMFGALGDSPLTEDD